MQRPTSFETPLFELEVLIVDCQTTGATPEQGCVLELGWGVTRARDPEPPSSVHAHWIALPPGQRVSSPVRQLTGFHEDLLADALAPEVAWRRLCASVPAAANRRAPMPSAIHYARFELAFLRDWSRRFDPAGAAFPLEAVCVHAVACRLYPDLPRRNLRALAGFLGHGLELERRARGHVLATAFIWKKLVLVLAERGIRSWEGLASWLAEPTAARAPRRRTYPISRARYRSLPDGPGVYRLLRSNGDVLYVGKAKSLKKRVASHFGKQRGATERALEMLTQVHDVAFEPTATALEAALRETELIKALDPPYNIQLVGGDRGVWFASGDLAAVSPTPDEVHRLGPLSSRFSVRGLRAAIELLAGEPSTPSRRGAATGAPRAFAPDEATFAEGWALFTERRIGALPRAAGDARHLTLAIARELVWLAAGSERAREEAAAGEDPVAVVDPEAASVEAPPPVWDPERVCRHLERCLAGGYQALRRAGWLCLLANSSLSFREPHHPGARVLLVGDAEVTARAGVEGEGAEPPEPSARPPKLVLQRAFDAARYDRLRVLTSELKRVGRDGGEVVVRLGPGRVLEGARLRDMLRLV